MLHIVHLTFLVLLMGPAQNSQLSPLSPVATQPTSCPAMLPAPRLDCPVKTLGFSHEHRPVEYAVMGEGKDVLLILAGIHGDERSGVELAVRLGNFLHQNPCFLKGKTVILLPLTNPDGFFYGRRENSRNVDLNRNFNAANRKKRRSSGKNALSEPEAQALKKLIERYRPSRIVSIHQIVKLKGYITRGLIDYNGPAEILACRMSEYCPLMVKKWGARPGSLGSYAGEELGIPLVTMEMHKEAIRENADQLWKTYGKALLAAIAYPERLPEKTDIVSERAQ